MFSDILIPKRWWRKLYGVHMKDFPEAKVVSTDSLIPYAMNSRTHSDKQIDQIAASIKEFGFLNPVIVDGENGIIAGHGRVMAAKKLGMAELPVVEAKHLTEAQKKAYVIADNKLAMNADWDYDVIRAEINVLDEFKFNLDLLGFNESELDEIVNGWSSDIALPESPKETKDSKIVITCRDIDKDDLLGVIEKAVSDSGIEKVSING